MRARGIDKWFANGVRDVSHFFSASPTDIIRPGDFASGNLTSAIQGNTLTAVTTPLYQQALTGAGDDPLGAGFTNATLDSFDAADSTVYDVSLSAFAWLVTYKLTSSLAVNQIILGKYTSTDGYMLYGINGTTARARWDAATADSVLASVGTADYLLMYSDPGIPRSGLYTGTSGDSGGPSTPNTASSNVFSLGSHQSWNAQGIVLGPCVFFVGSAAQTVIANRATDLPAWWSS